MAEVRGNSRVGPYGARGCGETRRVRFGVVGARGLEQIRDWGKVGWVSGAGTVQPWGQAPGWGPAWRGRLLGWGVMRGCRGGDPGGVAEIRSTKMGRGCW